MKKKLLIFVSIFMLMNLFSDARSLSLKATNSNKGFTIKSDSLVLVDSLAMDSSIGLGSTKSSFGLLDSIISDTILKSLFSPYLVIKQIYSQHVFSKTKRVIPTIKEVKERNIYHKQWMFWILILILIYVAVIRIVNPNNFRMFILSVFNLKLSEKIWEEQRSFYGFVILQLFAIYIFIASLFVSIWMGLKQVNISSSFIEQFVTISVVLFIIYTGKFILHTLLGYILQMKNLGIGMVSNTVSVNNFISIIILPLLVFLIYNNDPVVKIILSQTIIATFFLSVIFRVVRITLLSNSFFNFPKIYLFFYLCALEIFPWFVIIKFLNRFQI